MTCVYRHVLFLIVSHDSRFRLFCKTAHFEYQTSSDGRSLIVANQFVSFNRLVQLSRGKRQSVSAGNTSMKDFVILSGLSECYDIVLHTS